MGPDLDQNCLQRLLRPLVKSVYQKINFLISLENICCGYSKDPSH